MTGSAAPRWLLVCRDAVAQRGLDPACLEPLRAFPGAPASDAPAADFDGLAGQPTALLVERVAERLAEEQPGGAVTDVAILIADIRGSTPMAERMAPREYSAAVERFYNSAANILIDDGALIERLIGDEVAAIFAPGLTGERYIERAIAAGETLLDAREHQLPIGVGVHAGEAFVGVVGEAGGLTTFSALGDTVNVASRLCSAARSGELVVSQSACDEAGYDAAHLEFRELMLKGKSAPVGARVIPASDRAHHSPAIVSVHGDRSPSGHR